MIIVPLQPFYDFTEEIALSNILYIFNFSWNSRGEFWVLDVYNKDTNFPIVLGIKLLAEYDITYLFKYKFTKEYKLIVTNPAQSFKRLSENSFTRSEYFLIYLPEEEYAV